MTTYTKRRNKGAERLAKLLGLTDTKPMPEDVPFSLMVTTTEKAPTLKRGSKAKPLIHGKGHGKGKREKVEPGPDMKAGETSRGKKTGKKAPKCQKGRGA